jgi:hypothetical protein
MLVDRDRRRHGQLLHDLYTDPLSVIALLLIDSDRERRSSVLRMTRVRESRFVVCDRWKKIQKGRRRIGFRTESRGNQ